MPALALAALGVLSLRGISFERSARRRVKKSIELTLLAHVLGCVALIVAILTERLH